MPSLIGDNVAANYLKASPSTQFGTRQLSVISISFTGADTTPTIANSLFSQAVRALQQTAEVWAVFTPTSGAFNAIISTDSQWDGTGAPAANTPAGKLTDGSYTALEAAISASVSGAPTVTVAAVSGFSAPYLG